MTLLSKEENKKCPFCAELIKAEAVVCRHCGKSLASCQNALGSRRAEAITNLPVILVAILILFLLLLSVLWWYITIPILVSGYIWTRNKLDRKKKVVATVIIVACFAIAFGMVSYRNRTPRIAILDPKSEIAVQAEEYIVKGQVSPRRSSVSVIGQSVALNDKGEFATKIPLRDENNQITISARNGDKKKETNLVIKRIFTDEEKARREAIAKEEAEKQAQAKAQAEAKKKTEQVAKEAAKKVELINPRIELNIIDQEELQVTIKNNTGRDIDGVRFMGTFQNNFGEVVTDWSGDKIYLSGYQGLIKTGHSVAVSAQLVTWRSPRKVTDLKVIQVHFADGEVVDFL